VGFALHCDSVGYLCDHPGGLASFLAMPLVGVIIARVDPRKARLLPLLKLMKRPSHRAGPRGCIRRYARHRWYSIKYTTTPVTLT
jgi:hypothetical protein